MSDLRLDPEAWNSIVRSLNDITNAILSHQKAVELTPDGHALKATLFNNLAESFHTRFQRFREQSDFNSAIRTHQAASSQSSGLPSIRLHAALRWARLCSEYTELVSAPQSLPAYERVLELMPQVIWLGQNIRHRYQELSRVGYCVNDAAVAALASNNIPRALEWLEEARSVVWSQILQLRTPLDDLSIQYPEMAKKLENVSRALDNAGSSSIPDVMQPGSESQSLKTFALGTEDQARMHRALALEYEQLIGQVRQLEGFETFLRPRRLKELVAAATNGAVAVLKSYEGTCFHTWVLNPSETVVRLHTQVVFTMKEWLEYCIDYGLWLWSRS
ncbi:hypothetical protein BT96DRAFT_935062 [Gymnopus androsaceus JB14]|uniref:Uncharacterized protein n=1 Tax=Gymnopus androsaceus JB14 TaxID=1447944 RepID=A0A6A4I7G2_9AGAR|nr:hypothetical protein BT96DRAFT_935062 [Gymnopus androsaceus JB14]